MFDEVKKIMDSKKLSRSVEYMMKRHLYETPEDLTGVHFYISEKLFHKFKVKCTSENAKYRIIFTELIRAYVGEDENEEKKD